MYSDSRVPKIDKYRFSAFMILKRHITVDG